MKFLKINKIRLLYAMAIAFIILILGYVSDNYRTFIPESKALLRFLDDYVNYSDDEEDVLYINVANIQNIANYSDNNIINGKRSITDRQKLLRLLERLDSVCKYKCIFLDVRFEKGYETPSLSIWSAFLSIITIICYIKYNFSYNTFIPAIIITLVNDYKKQYSHE